MEFGVFWLLQQPHPDRPIQDRYTEVIEQVQDADELGFHCAWFAEHHFSNYGLIPSPLTFIAHLAARTRRIRLAPGILVLPFYNPLRLAEEAAMVDVLSGGRLICGIGRGYQAMEFRGYDVALEESRERYDECVAILLKSWTEEDWGFEGKHFRVPAGTTVLPRPVQRPHPPIWAGMWGSPESLRTAARNGWVPLVGGYTRSLDDVRAMRRAWDHELELVGRDPRSLPFTSVRHVTVLEDARDTRRFVEDNRWIDCVATALRRDDQVIRGGRISVRPPDEDLDDDEILRLSIIGTPDQVVERIRSEQACGVNYLLCHFDYGALPHDVVRRSMRLFADEVAPRLASPGSALSRAVG